MGAVVSTFRGTVVKEGFPSLPGDEGDRFLETIALHEVSETAIDSLGVEWGKKKKTNFENERWNQQSLLHVFRKRIFTTWCLRVCFLHKYFFSFVRAVMFYSRQIMRCFPRDATVFSLGQ
jgi:hypothetical protein